MSILKNILPGGLLLLSAMAHTQARLVLNGAKINITNGAQLVVDNPAADAITRYSGHIISEGENNAVKWNIGTATGTYTVPLGYNGTYLPLQFTKNAGAGYGSFSFATYHTTWNNNSQLPAGVTNLTFRGMNASQFIADRFWKMSPAGYTATPSITNLVFGYADAEAASPNTITESTLEARRWNSTLQSWTDYEPAATVNATANTVTIASVPAAQLKSWWLLIDNVNVLPVQGLVFSAAAEGNAARLNWSTIEDARGYAFTLERSTDGRHFTPITTVPGTATKAYTYLDTKAAGKTYYRVKQTDGNGQWNYSVVRVVWLGQNSTLTVYPNPVTAHRCTVVLPPGTAGCFIELVDMLGDVVFRQACTGNLQRIALVFPNAVIPGTYILKVTAGQEVTLQKLVVR